MAEPRVPEPRVDGPGGVVAADDGRVHDGGADHGRADHELRSPLAALRLTLEDLSLWPDATPAMIAELRHAVEQVERMSSAVAVYLEGGR